MQTESSHPVLMREHQAAEVLNVTVATLRRWRWAGTGPTFVKLGAAVRYSADDLATFIRQGRRLSTSEGHCSENIEGSRHAGRS